MALNYPAGTADPEEFIDEPRIFRPWRTSVRAERKPLDVLDDP
jgi:hypothetical protein